MICGSSYRFSGAPMRAVRLLGGVSLAETGMTAVEQTLLLTQDMELIADLLRQQYVGHTAAFRCADPAAVDGQVRTATAGGLMASWLGFGGFEYTCQIDPMPAPTTATVLQGSGHIATRREERRFTAGDVLMAPTDQPSAATMADTGCMTLQAPWAAVHALAEEHFGIPAQRLRFESTAPLSAAHQKAYADTARFIYDQLVTSQITSLHALVAESMTRLAAAAMLEHLPHTALTMPYIRDPGWVTPASVTKAAAFIHAHADQPVTLAQIAAAAGLTVRALRYGFLACYDLTPAQYQRRVRLERAHLDLHMADPGDRVSVATIARKWGWLSPARFTAAYQQRFGVSPSHTRRW